MAEVKWIKIVTDIFDDEKMLFIEQLPEADSVIVFLFQLICKSAKNGTGRLVFKIASKVEVTDDALAAVFRRDKQFVSEAMKLLENIGVVTRRFNSVEIHKFWVQARDRSSADYTNWRKAVFERDEYTCQRCKKKGGNLNAHHIKKWSKHPSLRYEISNGLTLCKICHKEVHKKR